MRSACSRALVVLRSVRSDPAFVPPLALTGALVLALASVGVFIYFIHHVASILQGTNITADIEQCTHLPTGTRGHPHVRKA